MSSPLVKMPFVVKESVVFKICSENLDIDYNPKICALVLEMYCL